MSAAPTFTTIHVHPQAPAKPAVGAVCNGCGICCLAEPCPLGVVVSRRRTGACVALRWDATMGIYRCSLVGPTRRVAQALWQLPRPWRMLFVGMAPVLALLSRRWIAAGVGCDCSLQIQQSQQNHQNQLLQTMRKSDAQEGKLTHD